jgi:hypothetical protein
VQSALFQPWLSDVLTLLELRRGERVMLLTSHATPQVTGVAELVGRDGQVVVLEPDADCAERSRALAHPSVFVVTLAPDGREDFGLFDAVLGCPSWNPGWEVGLWAELVRRNLRPGGRFVLDCPGEVHCEPVAEAWRAIGAPERLLARWRGPGEDELARGLRERGLRRVQGAVGAHLVRCESPRELADLAIDALAAPGALAESLTLALTERLRSHREVEVLFRRTRVAGMR